MTTNTNGNNPADNTNAAATEPAVNETTAAPAATENQAEPAAEPMATDAAATAPAETVSITFTGFIKGTATVAVGSTLEDAAKQVSESPGNFTYRDEKNKAVALSRNMTASMTVAVVEKARAG